MIPKNNGSINKIIDQNTVYNDGKSRYYPTINDLKFIITQIIESGETTSYLKFNPFYINSKLNRQIEMDDYMFYLECRESFSEDDLKSHLTECMDRDSDIYHEVKQYEEMSDKEKRYAHIMYPLCKKNDNNSYKKFLSSYMNFLDELVPILFEKVRDEINLSLNDFAFGFFCFEVHSN